MLQDRTKKQRINHIPLLTRGQLNWWSSFAKYATFPQEVDVGRLPFFFQCKPEVRAAAAALSACALEIRPMEHVHLLN